MKLEKTMLQYVLEEEKKGMQNSDRHLRFERILKIANFLSQPINISMFLPAKLVEGLWVVLEEPESIRSYYETDSEGMKKEALLRVEYQQAKENVIFEGFEFIESDEDFTTILNKKNKIKLHFDLKHKEIVFEISTQNGHLKTIENLIAFKLNLNTNYVRQLKINDYL